MAQVRPFRALRYSPAAGPLERLVAPPYDVISAEERRHYLALDPHNVVHLTLPESEEQAARELREWRGAGAAVRGGGGGGGGVPPRPARPAGGQRGRVTIEGA